MLKNLFLRIKDLQKTKVTKQLALVIFVFLVITTVVIVPNIARADFMDGITNVFAWILDFFMSMVGALVTLVLSVLINIAQFNEFTSATAVTTGWVLIRDICNMFFIVILLIISVGTVLGIQSYSYKNFLKKVIIMAILINFSKTIAGFLIDISQVIMLTFVAAFKDSIVIGFTEAFGLNKLKSLANTMDASGENEQDNFALMMGMLFGLGISIVLLLVLLSVVVMLAYRIVILWILVVLSPFAYLASALPGSLSGQAKQWWSKFSEQLIVGPAIAFFLWLTLSVVSATGGSFTTESSSVDPDSIIGGQLASAPFLLNYLLGIMLLVVGMQMAQAMGGKSGALMGKTLDGAKKYGWKSVKGTAKLAGRSLEMTAGRLGGAGIRKVADWAGAKEGGERAGSALHLAAARSHDRLKGRQKARAKTAKNILDKTVGTGDGVMDALATRGQRPKEEAISRDVNSAIALATNRWDEGDVDAETNEHVSAEQIREDFVATTNAERQQKKEDITSSTETVAKQEWADNREDILRDYRLANPNIRGDLTEEQIDNVKAEYVEGRVRDTLAETEDIEDLHINDDRTAELYKSAYEGEARIIAEEKYKKKTTWKINPAKQFYDVAEKEVKDKRLAERKGRIFAEEPDRFTAGDVEDNLGDIKSKATKAIYKEMTTEQVDKLVKTVDEEVASKAPGTDAHKKALKKQTALYKSLKHLDDEKVDNDASKYYAEKLSSKYVVTGSGVNAKSKQISEVTIEKSSKDYMHEGVTKDQISNTKAGIVNEINNLGLEDEVVDKSGETGWYIDKEAMKLSSGDDVILRKDDRLQKVSKDEFVRNNESVLSDRFYDSGSYEEMKSTQGDDSVLTEEQYKEYEMIRKSSQNGITMGSLQRGGNIAAVDLESINDRAGRKLVGEQRKAGMFVKGEDAVLAAGAMKEVLSEQSIVLESANTDEEIKSALKSFGVVPKDENGNVVDDVDWQALQKDVLYGTLSGRTSEDLEAATTPDEIRDALVKLDAIPIDQNGEIPKDLDWKKLKSDKLSEIKEVGGDRVGGAYATIDNLNDEKKIEKDGLILLDKKRDSRGAKDLERHEMAHEMITNNDPDKIVQDKVWSSLTTDDQQAGLEYIRKDRNQPNMEEVEAKKEWIADAFANTRKPGGPDVNKPQLPVALMDKLRRPEVVVDDSETGGKESKTWTQLVKEKMTMKAARKVAKGKVAQEDKIKDLKNDAKDKWSKMSKDEKIEFMEGQGANEYSEYKDREAFKLYEDKAVSRKLSKGQKQQKKQEKKLATAKSVYYDRSNIVEKEKALFTERYNTNKDKETRLNKKAEALELEAAQDRKDYLDPNNENASESIAAYQRKTKEANNIRKEANAISKQNANYKLQHDKDMRGLEGKAMQAKRVVDKQLSDIERSKKSKQDKSDPEIVQSNTSENVAEQKTASSSNTTRNTLSNISNNIESGKVVKEETLGRLEELRDGMVDSNTSDEMKEQITSLINEVNGVKDMSSPEGKSVINNLQKFVTNFNKDISQKSVGGVGSTNVRVDNAKSETSNRKTSTVTQVPKVRDTVNTLRKMVTTKGTTSQQIVKNLRDLQNGIEINMPEQSAADYDGFLKELRGLIGQAESVSSVSNEEQNNLIAGQTANILNNIPPGMLKAGKPKDKRSVSIPKSSPQVSTFLDKPLSMRQFLMMKKWFQQQGNQMKKLGAEQSATSSDMQKKIASLNQRISNVDTKGDGDIDMQVMLKEEGFSSDEIEQIVDNYTSEQADNE